MLHVIHRVLAKVENAGGEHGIGFAFTQHIDHVVQIACPTTGDDRDTDGLTHSTGEGDVVTGFGAIRIHAGEQDLASPAAANLRCPLDGVELGGVASAMGVNSP